MVPVRATLVDTWGIGMVLVAYSYQYRTGPIPTKHQEAIDHGKAQKNQKGPCPDHPTPTSDHPAPTRAGGASAGFAKRSPPRPSGHGFPAVLRGYRDIPQRPRLRRSLPVPAGSRIPYPSSNPGKITSRVTCRYGAQRNSGQVHPIVGQMLYLE